MPDIFGFGDILNRTEELNPILRPYIRTGGPMGEMIQHPLIQEVMYRKELNALINERFRHKTEGLAKAIATKQWRTVVYLHERPWRLDALLRFRDNMSDEAYWGLVASVWTDSENIWQNYDEWRSLWENPRRGKALAMDEDEHAALAAMPDIITVYRGVHGKGITKSRKKIGLSWTIDRKKAEWFAQRYQTDTSKVLEGTVKKSDVHAYLTGRNESEIVATAVKVKK